MNKNWTRNWTRNGINFKANIAPCSWMYNGGAQVSVIMMEGDKPIQEVQVKVPASWEKVTEAELITACDSITLGTCACGKPFMNDKVVVDFDKDDHGIMGDQTTCETCRLAEIDKRYDEEAAKEKAAEKKRDARYKAKGFNFKTIMWVHAGGDDRCLEMYTKVKPTDHEIQASLKRRHSRVLNDYTVMDL